MERYGDLPDKGSFDGQRNRFRSVTAGGTGLCGPTQSLFLCLRLDSFILTVNQWPAAILAVLMQRFCKA